MTQLIGIAGKARAGKDTAARTLKKLLQQTGNLRCEVLHFADPLKKMAAAFEGSNVNLYHDDITKERVIPWLGITRRKLMQMFGSEVIKPHFGNDVWVKRLMVEVELLGPTTDFIIVPDVRFDLEAQAIRDKRGINLRICRPDSGLTGPEALHSSELGVDPDLIDTTIDNDGTLSDFEQALEGFRKYAIYQALGDVL